MTVVLIIIRYIPGMLTLPEKVCVNGLNAKVPGSIEPSTWDDIVHSTGFSFMQAGSKANESPFQDYLISMLTVTD